MQKILLIGGSDAARAALKTALEAAGYRVSAAIVRKYTNRWLGRRIKPFDLIIYDLAEAPQPSEFWPELRQAGGSTPVLVLADPADPVDYVAHGMTRVLPRPAPVEAVVTAAGELLS